MNKKTEYLLRAGLIFVFLYASISSFIHPDDWVGFIPGWMRQMVSPKLLLYTHALGEIILALWLLSGKKLFWASILSAISLASITLANLGSMDLVFRDVGLTLAALALASLVKSNK